MDDYGSLSSWRAWIEITSIGDLSPLTRRSPHGERGLKSGSGMRRHDEPMSLSSWRAWIEITPVTWPSPKAASRSPHGERGLKYSCRLAGNTYNLSRSPHGERGLKLKYPLSNGDDVWSLSSWRAWIEIPGEPMGMPRRTGRSPHGERGLKSTSRHKLFAPAGRSPHGERGLKSCVPCSCG